MVIGGGLIGGLFELLFGGGRNVVRETAEVFRENAEAGARRGATLQQASLAQHAAEFGRNASGFDQVMDGINRIPRPALALGTLALFLAAMWDPAWFSARMQGLALVPEPLWWLLGVVVSFYFGARHQIKSQNFQREIAATLARTPQVVANLAALEQLGPASQPQTAPDTPAGDSAERPARAATGTEAGVTLRSLAPEANPALDDWRKLRAS